MAEMYDLCQNAQAYARKIEEKKEIARAMRNIFSHDSKEDALMALRSAVQYWAETKKPPKFAGWLENNAEESMTYESCWRLPESGIVREACRLATDGATRRMDGRKSLLNREGNGNICFLCMNLQKRTCLIKNFFTTHFSPFFKKLICITQIDEHMIKFQFIFMSIFQNLN